jgi:hypothetical protein
MLTATAYDTPVEQLFDRIQQLHSMMTPAGIPYRIVGGMAVYTHVYEQDPLRARLTADVDAAIDRGGLPSIVAVAEKEGLVHRHVAGVDMLVDKENPRARSAIHLVFVTGLDNAPIFTREGFAVAAVVDLVRMKLTSYRLKDRVHIQDLDGAGLITAEIEAGLPEALRMRLCEIRATE